MLALGPYGWVETTALVVCGVLGVGFGLALCAEMPTSLARLGAALVAVVALAVVFTAFTVDAPGDPTASWHDRIHNGVYPLIPFASVAAAACLAGGLRRDQRWRLAATMSPVVACCLGVALGLSFIDAIAQLARYLLFVPLLVWIALLAQRLLVISRERARETARPAQRYAGSRGSTN